MDVFSFKKCNIARFLWSGNDYQYTDRHSEEQSFGKMVGKCSPIITPCFPFDLPVGKDKNTMSEIFLSEQD